MGQIVKVYKDGIGYQVLNTDNIGAALEAGDNISIDGNEISAVDTTYSAGTGLSLSGTTFSLNVDYGADLSLSIDPSTFVLTAQLKNQNGGNIGTAQTIDLPLESVVVSGSYNSQTKEVELTLQSGSVIRFSVADLVSGLQEELVVGDGINIDANNEISVDTSVIATKEYVDDSIAESVSSGPTAPLNPTQGMLRYDTVNDVLKSYDGTQWNEVGNESTDINTKAFYLSGTSDLINAQAAYDWFSAGKNPIVMYNNRAYLLYAKNATQLIFQDIENSAYDQTSYTEYVGQKIIFTLSGNDVTAINYNSTSGWSGPILRTDVNYSTPYTPTYAGSPTTKQYVDNNDTYIGASAPTDNVVEGRLWYDTTNDVLKVYDGTNWNEVGGDTYTAGTGISIDSNNEISADTSVIATKQYVDDSIAESVSSGSTAPSNPTEGQLWYDTTNDVLKVYDGTNWNEIGSDVYTAGTGIDITNNVISADTTTIATKSDLDEKQDLLTAGDNITIQNECVTENNKKGPCPSGFHVPTYNECTNLINAGITIGAWASGGGDSFKAKMKMPYSGYRSGPNSANIVNRDYMGFVWTCEGYTIGDPRSAYSLLIGSGNLRTSGDYRHDMLNIRPFKNEGIAPDSSWTTIYDGSSTATGAGIFHNAELGLISISTDGSTWTTIADKNLGATTVYNDGDTLSEANCGKYYQRGNNYGFQWGGNITNVSTTPIDGSSYGPNNYYYNETLIYDATRTFYDWSTVQNDNVWGGTSQGTFQDCSLTISATGGAAYTAGTGIDIDQNNEISVDTSVVATKTDLTNKQDKMSAGKNITIGGNIINAKDTEYTAGNNVTITCPTESDMKGPSPSGFHVPDNSEFRGIYGVLTNTLGLAADGTTLRDYLKMPYAGYRSYLNGGRTIATHEGYYGTSQIFGDSGPYYFMFRNGYVRPDRMGGYFRDGYSIRCFKNTPVVPDNTWTTLYDGSSVATGAGVFHNATLGLISVSGDGTTWTTIMDKNLGATTVYNNGDSKSEANCGGFFQFGNNYMFPYSGDITVTSTQVDSTGYGPGNYYYSSNFIICSEYDWSSVSNNNRRGYVTHGTFQDCEHPIISAAGGATYTAGDNIDITNNVISAENVIKTDATNDTGFRIEDDNGGYIDTNYGMINMGYENDEGSYQYHSTILIPGEGISSEIYIEGAGGNTHENSKVDITNMQIGATFDYDNGGGDSETLEEIYSFFDSPIGTHEDKIAKLGDIENVISSGTTAPSNPTEGQLWYDTTNDILKVYNGTNWNAVNTDTTYSAGTGLTLNGTTFSADTTVLATKQDIADFGGFEVVATLPATGETNIIYLLGPIGTGADKYEEWIYASSTWTKIGETSVDLSNLNTKTFYLSGSSGATALEQMQEAYDWLMNGNYALLYYDRDVYIPRDWSGGEVRWYDTKVKNDGMALYQQLIHVRVVDGDVIGITLRTTQESRIANVLPIDNTTSFTPTGDYNPATKKYVDDSIAESVSTGSTAPSNPTEGQLWYDTTNDVLKVYDGTAWKEAGTQMKVLSYGHSTWQDFIDAYNENAIVYCRASSNSNPGSGTQGRMAFMAFVSLNSSTGLPTSVEFQYYRSRSDHNTQANQLDQVFVYTLTNASGGTWTVTERNTGAKAVAGTGISLAFGSGNMTISADTTTLATQTDLNSKQDTLVSGTNIKTVNNNSLLGTGDITLNDVKVSATAPSSPTEGMTWYDTTNNVLKSYDGTNWSIVGSDAADINTKTFYLSDTNDLTNAQAAYDWFAAGKNPIVIYYRAAYILNDSSATSLQFVKAIKNSSTTGNSYSRADNSRLTFTISSGTVTEVASTSLSFANFLSTTTSYQTPYTPQYPGSPATKKYVDDTVASAKSTGSTAPSNPTEGQLWYDTTNDVLKVYDGTNWNEVGGGETYTAGNGIDISVETTHPDSQGPAPDGFHVPTTEERAAVLTAVTTTLGLPSTIATMNEYLKMPCAGFRSTGTAGVIGQGSGGYYWSSTGVVNSGYYSNYLTFNQYETPTQGYGQRANGYSIRIFKDEAVIPDNSWTVDWQPGRATGQDVVGIYHNSTLGLISISGDGTTWYTMSDKNLGATTAYNIGDTLNANNCGNYYQRGNNYGFAWTGSVTTSTTKVDTTGYGPGNYYNDDTFIYGSDDWSLSTNDNLRGSVTHGTRIAPANVISNTGVLSVNGQTGNVTIADIYSDYAWVAKSGTNIELSINSTLTPTANFTINAPAEIKDGQIYILRVTSGGALYNMSLGTNITNPFATDLTLTRNGIDQFVFMAIGGNLELQPEAN